MVSGVDVEFLNLECSQFQKQFKQLPSGARAIPVYKDGEAAVKNMMLSLHLISSLLSLPFGI